MNKIVKISIYFVVDLRRKLRRFYNKGCQPRVQGSEFIRKYFTNGTNASASPTRTTPFGIYEPTDTRDET